MTRLYNKCWYRSVRPKCNCLTKRHRTMHLRPTRCQIAPLSQMTNKKRFLQEGKQRQRRWQKHWRIWAKKESTRHPHVTNQEIIVLPSVNNSDVTWSYCTKSGRKSFLFTSPFFFFFRNVASLIDSLVTRGAITKNSNWLSAEGISIAVTYHILDGRDFLARWPEAPSWWKKTYTSSWQNHVLLTSRIASPCIHLSLLKTFLRIDVIWKSFEANLTSTLFFLVDCQRLMSTFSLNMSPSSSASLQMKTYYTRDVFAI